MKVSPLLLRLLIVAALVWPVAATAPVLAKGGPPVPDRIVVTGANLRAPIVLSAEDVLRAFDESGDAGPWYVDSPGDLAAIAAAWGKEQPTERPKDLDGSPAYQVTLEFTMGVSTPRPIVDVIYSGPTDGPQVLPADPAAFARVRAQLRALKQPLGIPRQRTRTVWETKVHHVTRTWTYYPDPSSGSGLIEDEGTWFQASADFDRLMGRAGIVAARN